MNIKHETFENDGLKGIKINDWEIHSSHKPILQNKGIEEYCQCLGFNVPEMLFGDNYLAVKHIPSGLSINLNALDALKLVEKGDKTSGMLKVKIAENWTKKSIEKNSSITKIVNPFDWTFSTKYNGTLLNEKQVKESEIGIDYEKLKIPEPLLFFDQNVLFEDDLGDNGVSSLSYKVRVMQSGFFILMRFFLRVDGVSVRIWDTRIYCSFENNLLIREITRKQSTFSDIANRIVRLDKDDEDLSMLNNSDFVNTLMNSPEFGSNEQILY
ncbi:hypothetical protein BB558_003202 [Smittium angustum]|uniref:TIP41-like protein n=1 Tax=Smittium angustum TaxID=133377 RepID=A0A2U1J6Y1_SMIAN|nr:hypothetical protein BB558_003202 [Smittium angustum]